MREKRGHLAWNVEQLSGEWARRASGRGAIRESGVEILTPRPGA
jgi:hypothetical protein